MFLCLFSLLCCAFILLKTALLPVGPADPCTEHSLAVEGHLAALPWAAGCFFPFSNINYLTFHCLYFLLVKEFKELFSSPNALAANSDPGCSFFFSHIHPSPAVTDAVQPQLSHSSPFHSLPAGWSCWMEPAGEQGCQFVLNTQHTLSWSPACAWTSPSLGQ